MQPTTQAAASPAAARREENRRRHLAARLAAQGQRGPRGVAAAWWDQARAVAAAQERAGRPEAWDDLARFLENYCQRYGQ
ncbi:hypothetical protein F0L17_26660 [Streptomyces sp. TRM43335]|uniref:Uncharacterized protein n=1 Tax=Streptomyces taklimakanensis TaxID=2569853 RepID=A0A6G2BKM6_9ACTN|nr:hypothetical protein [Streptomyces taklimakanensis]MTE22613.1 hypothetical protein [Streptomyces taklimakanensis]